MLLRYVDDTYIDAVFNVMEEVDRHTYLVLTKRPERMASYLIARWGSSAPANIWIGTTVEHQATAYRAEILASIPAEVRFLSCEPLVGPITDINVTGIDWLIVGGESGPKDKIRPMSKTWVDDLVSQIAEGYTHFFFKQWGGHRKCDCHGAWGCRLYMGQVWNDAPEERRTTQSTLGVD